MHGMHRLAILVLASLASVPAHAAARIAESGRYICADGSSLAFDRRGYGPVLLRDGGQIRLVQRWVFSGFRFVGEGLDLRGRGREGEKTLVLRQPGRIELLCRAVPAGQSPGVVTGQLLAPAVPLTALPVTSGARLEVQLMSARSPQRRLARVEITPESGRWPLAYWLSYPPQIVEGRLSARLIDRAGRTVAATAAPRPLPKRSDGRHASADLTLVPLKAASAPSSK